MSKPDFDKWAENLIEEYTRTDYSNCVVTVYDPRVVSKALSRAWEQGYRYAVKNDWWTEQEKQS